MWRRTALECHVATKLWHVTPTRHPTPNATEQKVTYQHPGQLLCLGRAALYFWGPANPLLLLNSQLLCPLCSLRAAERLIYPHNTFNTPIAYLLNSFLIVLAGGNVLQQLFIMQHMRRHKGTNNKQYELNKIHDRFSLEHGAGQGRTVPSSPPHKRGVRRG